MLPIRILANQVTNLTDARYFAARGVDYICMNDGEQTDGITIEEMNAIAEWVEGPEFLLHFTSSDYYLDIVDRFEPAGLIFNKDHLDTVPGSIQSELKFVIYKIDDFETFGEEGISGTDIVLGFDYIILDLKGTGKTLEQLIEAGALPIIQAICAAGAVFLDVPVSASSLHAIIEDIKPEGWVLHGGSEDKVGVKTYEELDDFFDVLENIDLGVE